MKTREDGFTLIELLVAVVILAVGILGIAGLQVVALQQNRGALYRAEATQLANDIMDRIRVNTDVTYSALIDGDPATTTNCSADECTRTEMMDYDIAQWKCSINDLDADGNKFTVCDSDHFDIDGALPEGRGSISKTSGIYVVTIEWVTDSNGTTSSVKIRSQVD